MGLFPLYMSEKMDHRHICWQHSGIKEQNVCTQSSDLVMIVDFRECLKHLILILAQEWPFD